MKQNSESYAQNEQLRQRALLRRLSRKIENSRDRLIFSLILETGCKPEELAQIKPSDFEFTTCSIYVGTGDERRRVKIPLELSWLIKSFTDKGGEFLLESRQSSKITPRRVIQIVEGTTSVWFEEPLTVGEVRALAARQGLPQPKERTRRKQKQTLSDDELSRIEEKISDEQHKLMFKILSGTGCRVTELVDMHVKDAETLPAKIAVEAKDFAAKRKISASDYLFSTRQSDKFSDKRIFQIMKSYASQAGFADVSPQVLRNTAIARALRSGAAHDEIEAKFGVKNVRIEQYEVLRIGKKRLRRDLR